MKICIECKKKKDLDEFDIRKDRENKIRGKCKECTKNERREKYQKDKEKYRKQKREWINRNKERVYGNIAEWRKTENGEKWKNRMANTSREKRRKKNDDLYEQKKEIWKKVDWEIFLPIVRLKNMKIKSKRNYIYTKVARAIMRGELVKSDICEICKLDYTKEAHHQDYSKPLAIVWLCKLCHGELHRQENLRGKTC